MSDLIHSVADLIDERDREGLEVTLARVTFELAQARALTFWRVLRRAGGITLRRRVALPQSATAPLRDDIPLIAASDALRLAHESKSFVCWSAKSSESAGCALPVLGASEVLGLMEIEAANEFDRAQISLFAAMLRIYRSHLAALDYGDIDELTRLANRRTFDEQFSRFARRNGGDRIADAGSAHLGVADIDYFKHVNDRFGHPFGDEVLVLFAGLMRDTFRESDKLFRFGGEEFVILLSNCEIEDARAAFERFRAAVAAYPFPQGGQVTVSIGATALKRQDTGSAAFGRADQALYVAKRRGRNRVLLFEALRQSLAPASLLRAAPDAELF